MMQFSRVFSDIGKRHLKGKFNIPVYVGHGPSVTS